MRQEEKLIWRVFLLHFENVVYFIGVKSSQTLLLMLFYVQDIDRIKITFPSNPLVQIAINMKYYVYNKKYE